MGETAMSDIGPGLTVPQFTVPDQNANKATVPDEFARYSEVLDRSYGANPPTSAGTNTTGEVGL